jgi:error-prone DNA polymerase
VPDLPALSLGDHVVADYDAVGLSLKAHPLGLLRPDLDRAGARTAAALGQLDDKAEVRVAGLVVMRQQPPTAKGTVFITLEDETGGVNLVVWKRVWAKYRPVARGAVALLVEGTIQKAAGVVHVCPSRIEDLSHFLGRLATKSRDFR